MPIQTRIQLSLQRDSGSIFYQDQEHDNLTFHIEALRSTNTTITTTTTTTTSAHNKKMTASSSDQASQASTALTSESEHETISSAAAAAAAARGDDADESEAETDLIKSFLRQHLLKNGEPSRCLIPLMKKDGIEAMLIATVALHLRKDGHGHGQLGEGEGDETSRVRDDGAAIRSLHKTLGSLVSVLQQRERVLTYLEENPHVVVHSRTEAEEK
ncbi:hypothetical protein DHEL01_v203714 [Diaporthe helianthi]|uniref:Uncharacterized protein n=1 Tax=Diaporthe helianthi TaxID=158607 RepID=A0A2P5I5V8_DIAHE|nr:hypothetical protein DHEL01_v203714 [Diaporthe helianthi]